MDGGEHWWKLQPTAGCPRPQGKLLLSCSVLGIHSENDVEPASSKGYKSVIDSYPQQRLALSSAVDDEAVVAPPNASTEDEQAGQARDPNHMQLRKEIESIYLEHNPAKLEEVPSLIDKYGEVKLLTMVRKKYKQQRLSDRTLQEQEERELAALATPMARPSTQIEVQVRQLEDERTVSQTPLSPRREREEIEALYAAHEPPKLEQVDTLLAKYGARKLLMMVRKKYNVLSPRKEIEALYEQHNPEKLPEVDTLIAKYGEGRLLVMVRKKYGVVSPQVAPPSEPERVPEGRADDLAEDVERKDRDHEVEEVAVVVEEEEDEMVREEGHFSASSDSDSHSDSASDLESKSSSNSSSNSDDEDDVND
jgi:hypothetical protein